MATYNEIADIIHGVYHQLRISVDGVVLPDKPDNVEFNNSVNDSTGLEIGTAYSSHISFVIENPSRDLSDKELLIEDGVRDTDGSFKYTRLGYFTVSSVANDRGICTYTCYDRMAFKFSGAYESALTFPTTDKAIIEEICSKCGVTKVGDTLTAHSVTEMPTGTYKTVLSYMLQLQGKNAYFNADGNLHIGWYTQTTEVIDDSRIYFDGTASTAEPFVFGFVKNTRTVKKTETKYEEQTEYRDDGTEVTTQVPYTEETSEEVTYSAGTGLQGIQFENPYMTQEIVNELYNKLNGFTYTPSTFNIVGDFRIKPMTIVTVSTNNDSYTVPVMSVVHSCDGGVTSVIASYGQSESGNSLADTSGLSKSMARWDADIAFLKTLTANSVTANVADIRYARLDKVNIREGWITTAMINDASITNAKILDLNAAKINTGTLSVERLEIRGSTNSIVYELNNITGALQSQNVDTLNGEVITPRTITAEQILAHSITANEMYVEDLRAIVGKIGGWDLLEGVIRSIGANNLYSGIGRSGYTNFAFFAGSESDVGENAVFRVGHDGVLNATSASISGSITATALNVNQNIYSDEYGTLDMVIKGDLDKLYGRTLIRMGALFDSEKFVGIEIDTAIADPEAAPYDGTVININSQKIFIGGNDSSGNNASVTVNKHDGYIHMDANNGISVVGATYFADGLESSGYVRVSGTNSTAGYPWIELKVQDVYARRISLNASNGRVVIHNWDSISTISPFQCGALFAEATTINNWLSVKSTITCSTIVMKRTTFLKTEDSEGTEYALAGVSSSNNFHFASTSYDNKKYNVYYNGNNVYLRAQSAIYSNKTIQSNSDARLKHEITLLPSNYMDMYMDIEPVRFYWNDDIGSGKQMGVIAQQVLEAMQKHGIDSDDCNIVKFSEDTETYGFSPLTVNYEFLNTITMAVVQNHENRIKALEAELEQLRSR